MLGTVIQILCSHEFFSVVEIIMCSNKNSKPGKMVQLLEYLPCRREDLSSIPSIWVEGPVYLYFQ